MTVGRDEPASTLVLTGACARTPLLVVAIGCAIALAGELFARTDLARRHLLVPAVSTSMRPLDHQVAGLAEWARARGRVPCLIMGSSVVWTGVDPSAVASGAQATGGAPIHCFNFGMPALTVREAAALARLVVADHRPSLLVYGFTARDFRSVEAAGRRDRILGLPWVRQRMGSPSVQGWLIEHSAAYRQALPYRLLARPRDWRAMRLHDRMEWVQGYLAEGNVGAAAPEPLRHTAGTLFGGADERSAPPDIGALETLLALSSPTTSVVLVEVPVHAHARAAFTPLVDEYRAFVQAVRGMARRYGTPLMRPSWRIVPNDGWNDVLHMNPTGARHFGRWLGGRLARIDARAPASPDGA